MKRYITTILCLLAAGCVTTPEVSPDQSAIVGVITARPHSEILAKWTKDQEFELPYDRQEFMADGGIDYRALKDIYVGLIGATPAPAAIQEITFTEKGPKPEGLAIAVGSRIRIKNATGQTLSFYVSGVEGDAFQDLVAVPAGGTREAEVKIAGELELTADENDDLVARILARPGLDAHRIENGDSYAFKGLTPGEYDLIVWHWRLGKIERHVRLRAGTVTHVDEVLAVDRTVQ